MALVWLLASGALVLLLAFLALIFFLYFWGGSGREICFREDLVTDFPKQRAELNELRELILTLNGKTAIRGLWRNIPNEPSSNPYVLVEDKKVSDGVSLNVAIHTHFADQRAELLRMKRLLDSLGLSSANVSDGDFFMAWRGSLCGYIHVGARSGNPYHSRRGSQQIPGEKKWFAFED